MLCGPGCGPITTTPCFFFVFLWVCEFHDSHTLSARHTTAYGVLLVACVVGILTFLACEWSIGIKARLRYAVVAAPNDAQHVRVVPDRFVAPALISRS